MSMNETSPVVAIVGATGHTARFIVEELLHRKIRPIAIARNLEALAKARFSGEVLRRRVTLEDAKPLELALDGAEVVINCAGPFIDSADTVAAAALRAEIHYLDVTAEPLSVLRTLEKFDAPAREAGVAVIPSVGFYGGFADLLVTAALCDWDGADTIEVMIGLDSWHPTLGTRKSISRISPLRETAVPGSVVPELQTPLKKHWDFGDPLGDQLMVEFSFTENILIRRHVKTSKLHIYLSDTAISDVSDPATPVPKAVDEAGRSAQDFVVEAVVVRGAKSRRAIARGRDTYAFTAPLVCEVAERLFEGKFDDVGAHAPGEILAAKDVLAALRPDHLTFEIGAG